MRNLGKSLALLMASGLCAASAGAQNLNLTNHATRGILIQEEDTPCTNSGTNDLNFWPTNGNADCTAPNLAGANVVDPGDLWGTCTGAGTGTFPGPRPPAPGPQYYPNNVPRGGSISPDYEAPAAGCTTYAADGGADFSDPSNDFYGTLTYNGGTSWTITVDQYVWGKAIAQTLSNTPGTTLVSNSTLSINFDDTSGAVSVGANAPYFYTAAATYGALNLVLQGAPTSPDQPYFGTGYQLGNTAPLTFSCAGAFANDNPSGSGVASPYPAFPLSETGVLFGPGFPWALYPGTACGSYTSQPGFNAVKSTLTAFAKSIVSLNTGGSPPYPQATQPAWSPYDFRLQEAVDTDGDLVPDQFDTDDDDDGLLDRGNASCTAAAQAGDPAGTAFASSATCCTGPGTGTCVADNCRRVKQTAAQVCDHDGDGFGDFCDPDFGNNGGVNVVDFNNFKVLYNSAVPATKLLADINCSGSTNIADFNAFKLQYNQTGVGSASSGGRLDSCVAAAQLNCTAVGVPYACCTGAGTGSCSTNAECTAAGVPLACCTGAGTGTCTSAVSSNGVNCN